MYLAVVLLTMLVLPLGSIAAEHARLAPGEGAGGLTKGWAALKRTVILL